MDLEEEGILGIFSTTDLGRRLGFYLAEESLFSSLSVPTPRAARVAVAHPIPPTCHLQSRIFLKGVLWAPEGRANKLEERTWGQLPEWLAGWLQCAEIISLGKRQGTIYSSKYPVYERRRLNYLWGEGKGEQRLLKGKWSPTYCLPVREDTKGNTWVHFALKVAKSEGVFILLCNRGGGKPMLQKGNLYFSSYFSFSWLVYLANWCWEQ